MKDRTVVEEVEKVKYLLDDAIEALQEAIRLSYRGEYKSTGSYPAKLLSVRDKMMACWCELEGNND